MPLTCPTFDDANSRERAAAFLTTLAADDLAWLIETCSNPRKLRQARALWNAARGVRGGHSPGAGCDAPGLGGGALKHGVGLRAPRGRRCADSANSRHGLSTSRATHTRRTPPMREITQIAANG